MGQKSKILTKKNLNRKLAFKKHRESVGLIDTSLPDDTHRKKESSFYYFLGKFICLFHQQTKKYNSLKLQEGIIHVEWFFSMERLIPF
jgi:hypothetical protein